MTRSVPALQGKAPAQERMRPAEPRKPGRGSPARTAQFLHQANNNANRQQ